MYFISTCIIFQLKKKKGFLDAFVRASGLTQCRPYFYNGADTSRDEDKQAGLFVDQIQENHNGAKASPQHCENRNVAFFF